MARQTKIDLAWPDETRTYHLDIPRLKELQEKRGAGPAAIAQRIVEGTFKVEDVLEPIRLGLIGGGLVPSEALTLVNRLVEVLPLYECAAAALSIITAALKGVEVDEGKAPPTKSTRQPGRKTTGSTSPASKQAR